MSNGKRTEELLEKLVKYGGTDYYPFHMPGHKRQVRMGITSFPNPFSVDITEIDGFDNLHHPEGILKEAMEQAAKIYGSDRTYFMVNGSTGGILSAVCGLTRPGGRILMARNCHKSAYHAVMLNHLDPVYVYPKEILGRKIQGGVCPEAVERILSHEMGEKNGEDRSRRLQAVMITSPTYEGIVSDVEKIAKLCHHYGLPLIVDEAHGSHFPFGEAFPESALSCGADVVIQSLHKTLSSLTQTALLHVKGDLVEPGRIEQYLSVFETSSPSYVLLASAEKCIFYMNGDGRREMEVYGERLRRWMERAGSLRMLKVLEDADCHLSEGESRDLSKLVVLPGRSSLLGTELADRLRTRFHLEPEMACSSHVILMTSLLDTQEGFERLWNALWEIDQEEAETAEKGVSEDGTVEMERRLWDCGDGRDWMSHGERAPVRMTDRNRRMKPADAWNEKKCRIPFSDAAGKVSGCFVTVYPPGIPMLVPGERIREEIIDLIEINRKLGLTVEGVSEDGRIEVVAEWD